MKREIKMRVYNTPEKNLNPLPLYVGLGISIFLILLVAFKIGNRATEPSMPISAASSSSLPASLPKPARVQTAAEKRLAIKKAHELAVKNNKVARLKLEHDRREARIQKAAAIQRDLETALILKDQSRDEDVYSAIKSKMRRDYPDDYVSQKGVYDMQVDAYQYMKALPYDEIKAKMIHDYPDDYISQKGVYEMQVKAKSDMR